MNSAPVVVASNQSDIPINVDKVGATAFTLGQANATLSLPVVLTAAQIAALTPPAAITNYAEETGGNLATIAGAVSSSKFQVNVINTTLAVTESGTWTVGSNSVTGSGVPANAFFNGARAQNAETTADTNGQLVGLAADLVGKLIVMPYANKENFVSGLQNVTGTSYTQIIAAQAAGLKIYLTGFSIANTGASNTLVTFYSGSGASTPIWTTIAPTLGGSNYQFLTPVSTAAATGLFFNSGTASSNVYVAVNGYIGT